MRSRGMWDGDRDYNANANDQGIRGYIVIIIRFRGLVMNNDDACVSEIRLVTSSRCDLPPSVCPSAAKKATGNAVSNG